MISATLLGAALAVGGLVAGAETTQVRAVIDFEGLAEGATVTSVQIGSGMSGDPVAGRVGVFGRRAASPTTSAAMIFDGACLPGGNARSCTGQDSDLFFPALGNLLIVSEDGDAADPDDAEDGTITFDFTTLGDGSVRVESFLLADTDNRRPVITWTVAGGATRSLRLPSTGNNNSRRIDMGFDDVTSFTITMNGAGAIDGLALVVPTTPPATPTTSSTTTTSTTSTTTTTPLPTGTTSTTTTTVPVPTVPPAGPAITLTVAADGQGAEAAPGPLLGTGAAFTWSHTVTNVGTEDLWSLIVWHDGFGRADCPTRTLRIGDSVVCTLAATADRDLYAADVDATAWAGDGSEAAASLGAHYTTIGGATTTTAPGTTTTSTTSTTSTTLPGATTTTTTSVPAGPPELRVLVTIAGAATDTAPGPELGTTDPVNLEYAVTNSGGETLYALYLWHDGIGRADCPVRTLAPGATAVCTATTAAGVGEHASIVDADTWDATGARFSAEAVVHWHTDTVAPPPDPSLGFEVFINGESAASAPGPAVETGELVTIEYRATNTGGVPLYSLWVWDAANGRAACPERTLPLAGTVVCTLRVNAGPGANSGEALARAWDAPGAQIDAVGEYHFFGTAAAPSVSIEVYVEGFDGDYAPGPRLKTPGEVINFTYVVTNTGRTPLTAITVTDSRRGSVDCPHSQLALGQTMTCNDTDITRWGNHAGIGTVVADAAGTRVTDSDPVHWHTRDEPRIHNLVLEASVAGADADTPPGPTIRAGRNTQIRYSITNRGNTWMNDITIFHPGVPSSAVMCTGDDILGANETLICWATVQAQSGQYAAEVTIHAWDNDGRRAETTDMVHYFGS